MRRLRFRLVLSTLALLVFGACGGKGCSCITPIKGGFPIADRHEGALQLRAAKSLFTYVGQNGPALISKLLPMGSMFDIPPSCPASGNQICCGNPQPTCQLGMDFKTLSVLPQSGSSPATLHLNTTLGLKTIQNLPVTFSGISCVISIDTARTGAATATVDADLAFAVNKTTDDTELNVVNPTLNGIDGGDINFAESGSDFLCIAGNIPGINSFIVGIFTSQVTGQLSNIVSGSTCMKCMDKSDCNSFASDCVMGQCVAADGKTCIQEVGLSGRMDVGKSLASLSPSTQAGLDVHAVLGGFASADTGLTLGMLGGGLPDPHSPCVPETPKPAGVTVPASKTFTTDVLPDGATPFHLGIGVHRSFLDQVGWAAFDGGALCLDIGTRTVALLTAKTIGVIIPSMSDLTHGDAPMFLVFRPHAPPTFTLGKGTFVTDMNGMKKIDDALLHIHVPDFHIDFYTFVDERYVRIMTLNANLEIPLSLDVDAMGQITPLLGDFSKAFTNVTVTNSELLAESPQDLAKTFPMLLGLAGGQLTSVLKPIALPALMGLNIKPTVITSTDPDKDGVNQFLSIFANLSLATTQSLRIDPSVRILDLQLPAREDFAVDHRFGGEPTLHVAVGGRGIGGAREFSWQLDGAGWSPWTETDQLTITHPLLWLPGHHALEVRGRAVGLPETATLAPQPIDVLVDPAGFHGRTTNPPAAGGCGCDVGGAPDRSSRGALLVLAIFGAFLLRRRPRALLLMLLAGTVGCNSSLGKGDYVDPHDEAGRYSDTVARDGVLHISAYDDSVGDLVYARVTDPAQPVAWQYVDGIDPAATADIPDGYRHGISDVGPDVGYFTSIALSQFGGDPRIAYYDLTDNAVKLAIGPKPWRIVTIDSSQTKGVKVGMYTAISLDANDVPSIAYLATGISDGAGGFRSELRLAVANNANPSDGEFTITVVDKTRVSCAGLCSASQACIQAAMVGGMPNGDPAQSSCVATDAACPTMCATTEACIMGACQAFLAAPKAIDLIEGIGLFTKAVRVNGAINLIYYDRTQGNLKLATQSNSSFNFSFIDGNDPSTDVGQHCTAAVDDKGTIHVAYIDAVNDSLLYKTVTGGTASMSAEVIDDGKRDDGPHPVGGGAALALANGSPRVVYQDQQLSDLLSAQRNGSSWSHQSLSAGLAGFGFYPRLAVDGGKIWLTQFVYDRENAQPPLGVLQVSTLN